MKKLLLLLPIALLLYAKPTLDADYDRGEELILVERMPLEYNTRIFGQFIYPNTFPLGSIYWNSNNSQYYYAKDGTRLTKTNGLTYKLDPKKEQEPSFIGEPQDLELVYAGYIFSEDKSTVEFPWSLEEVNKNRAKKGYDNIDFTILKRLYINPKTKEQYVKILEPIFDADIIVPKIYRFEPEKKRWRFYYSDGCFSTGRGSSDGVWGMYTQDELY